MRGSQQLPASNMSNAINGAIDGSAGTAVFRGKGCCASHSLCMLVYSMQQLVSSVKHKRHQHTLAVITHPRPCTCVCMRALKPEEIPEIQVQWDPHCPCELFVQRNMQQEDATTRPCLHTM